MRKIKTLVLGSALLGLMNTGQAMAEENSQSLALQIALSTGLTDAKKGPLFDTKRSDLPEELQNVPNHYVFEDALDAGLYGTLGLLELGGSYTAWARGGSISPDMANLAFAGLGLLLHSPTRPHPATAPQVIAWMPAEAPGSRRDERHRASEARESMRKIVREAAISALPDEYSASGSFSGHNFVILVGPDQCQHASTECRLWVEAHAPDRGKTLQGMHSWYWRNWQPGDKRNETTGTIGGPSAWSVNDKGRTRMGLSDDRDYLARFSGLLPEWVWVYLPPAEGMPAAMLNQGHLHFFIEPAG